MPQMMPIYWLMMLFFSVMIIMTLLDIFFYKGDEMILVKEEMLIMNCLKEFKW